MTMMPPVFFSTWSMLTIAVIVGQHLGSAHAPLVVKIDVEGRLLVKGHPPLMMADQIKTFFQEEYRRMQKRATDMKLKAFDPILLRAYPVNPLGCHLGRLLGSPPGLTG
jgi:hypothetical protein